MNAALRKPVAAPARPARGLGAIAVITVVVLLGAMVAAALNHAMLGAAASSQRLDAARAQSAANAGIEWGLYQVLKGPWSACSGQSGTLDLRADVGMTVTVVCTSQTYTEGESAPGVARTLRVTTLDATACLSSGAACPDAAAAVRRGYVERRRVATVADAS